MLYNAHLETLIRVVEAGSFRRAAEQIGISPSAVLKQISLLEKDLGVSVFDRTRRGVSLTEAGESIFNDSKYIIQYCEDAGMRARELQENRLNVIRVGVSPMTPGDQITENWPRLFRKCPDVQLRLTMFENSKLGTERAFRTIGQDIDLIIGIYDENFLKSYGLRALKIADLPAMAAVSLNNTTFPTGRKISVGDFGGHTVILPRPGCFGVCDRIRKELEGVSPEVVLEEAEPYTLDAFYAIQNSDRVLLSVEAWKTGQMLCRTIPVDWNYCFSYGVIHADNPSDKVVQLLEAVRSELISPEGISA